MYSPKQPPGTEVLKDLADWAIDEFREVEKGFQDLDQIRLIKTHVEPSKKRDGDIVYADGSDWDPGAGEGIYQYYGGTWNKMGFDPTAGTIIGNVGATDNRLVRSSGTGGITLDSTGITCDDSNNLTGIAGLTATTGTFTNLTKGGSNVAVVEQTDFISGLIPTVTDRDYKIVVKLPYAVTITEATTICASGTSTFTFKINTTALGGTANSVSSAEQSQTHSSSNVASAGDDLVITASSTSACLFASFTIKFTRTLS